MEVEIRDNRQKEWFWLDNEYLNGYARILGASCTVVYLSLCRHSDNQTQKCFPSIKLIAEENGISRDTVMRALKLLEEWRIVSILKTKKEDGTQANNVYTLTAKSVWRQKPSSIEQLGVTESQITTPPSRKNDPSRVAPEGCNNTHINNTQLTTLTSFDVFWAVYPKRENKKGCEEKWKAKKLDSKSKEILEFIEKAKESDRWKKGYIKAPLVFLNQESWNDDISAYNDINQTPKGILYF